MTQKTSMKRKNSKFFAIKIVGIILTIATCVTAGSYLLYEFYYSSNASVSSRNVDFGTTNNDYFMNEMGITLDDIGDTAQINDIIVNFESSPIFIRIENADPSVVDHANFAKIQEKGHFWYFSASTYASLRNLASAYYNKYPEGKLVLELTDQNARSDTETQALHTSFPKSRFVAANHMNWDREKTRELVNTSVPNHLTYPSLYGVSFFIDATEGLGDISENIALFWDMIFDASSDIAGTSVSVGWPHKNFNLALSEIKVTPRTSQDEILKDEARRLGIFITVYYNYAQKKGDDNRTGNNSIPIKYSGLGKYANLSPQAKKIASVFAMISRYKMAAVYPGTGAGVNLRDHKPLFGIVGYSPDAGHAIIFSNASNSEMSIKLPNIFASTSYSSFSTIRNNEFVIDSNNNILMRPYEVVAIYKTGVLGLPNTTVSPTQTVTSGQTASPTTSQSNTTTPTLSRTMTPTITVTPTRPPSPTLRPTSQLTTTQTPTPVPTTISKAFCDPRGCGVCGWRDTGGICHSDGALPDGSKCCYSACIANRCRYVSGFGTDKCGNDATCVSNVSQSTQIIVVTGQQQIYPSTSGTAMTSQKPQSGVVTISKSAPIPSTTPPVSGNTHPLYLLIVPAIVIILAAFVI